MAGPTDLYDLAVEYLAACQEATATTPGGEITERVYVSAGSPAFDCCPMLVVHAGGPAEADTAPLIPPLAPGHRATQSGAVHLIQLTATVIRCSPTVEQQGQTIILPSPALLGQVAQQTMADVWAVWNHVRNRYKAGALFSSPSGTRELLFDGAIPVNTSGGCAGWQVPIRVQLGGYVEAA